MESKKAISPLMLAIVIIIIGLVTLAFVLVFFTTIGGKASGEFLSFFEVAEPTCHEKCTIEDYMESKCINETEVEAECAEGKTFTGTSDCEELCCCT